MKLLFHTMSNYRSTFMKKRMVLESYKLLNQRTVLVVQIWDSLIKMKDVEFVWVPSLCGLEQNEEADQIANEPRLLPQKYVPISYPTAKALNRRHRKRLGKQDAREFSGPKCIEDLRLTRR